MLKQIYKEFQDRIKRKHKNFEILNFYFDKYNYDYSGNFVDKVIDLSRENEIRKEYSSMSIVLCKNKILTLVTSDNKYVLPKGHIEGNESTLETSIRECKEETGVVITEEDHIAEIKGFGYSFKGANCKYYTNSTFYDVFKVGQIDKKIFVHVFNVDEERITNISEPENFKLAQWLDIDDFKHFNSYKNQKQIVENALRLQKARVLFTKADRKYYKQLLKFKQEYEEQLQELKVKRVNNFKEYIDTKELLDFSDISKNSIDGVSDRDFVLELASIISIIMIKNKIKKPFIIFIIFICFFPQYLNSTKLSSF